MAFQIVDDLLDYTDDASVTGKPSGSDLREHKVTLPLIAALPRMGEAERRGVARLLHTPEPSDDQIAEVITTVSAGRWARLCPGAGPAAGPAGRRRARLPAAFARPGRPAGEHHLRPRPPALNGQRPSSARILPRGAHRRLHRRGLLTSFLRQWLPDSAAKTFFTSTASPTFGPVSADLLVVNFTLGPIGLHVSLLSLMGVLVAYLIARSLF